ncbi:MAG: hypothetical protein IPI65_15555 [Bacteroidetes bacterium]|nr:hypothetical protein [Bacteroidota bacterium]
MLEVCNDCGVIVLEQMDLPVTFDLLGVEYGLIGFGGAEASTNESDPTGAPTLVAKVIKSATAELWQEQQLQTEPVMVWQMQFRLLMHLQL